MKNRKITNKQEPYNIVAHFTASDQSQLIWCEEKHHMKSMGKIY